MFLHFLITFKFSPDTTNSKFKILWISYSALPDGPVVNYKLPVARCLLPDVQTFDDQ